MVTTKYLAKFQSPRTITRPKIIGPERKVSLICNLSLYTHIPNIKSTSQKQGIIIRCSNIAKKSGDNCFISELRTWVTLYVGKWPGHKKHIFCSSLAAFIDCIIVLSVLRLTDSDLPTLLMMCIKDNFY